MDEDEWTDGEQEEGGDESCGGVPGNDPLGGGVPGNAAGEEGWEDATDSVACEDGEATDSARGDEGATDSVSSEDSSTDSLADEDGATDSATEDEAELDITWLNRLFGTSLELRKLWPDMAACLRKLPLF